MVTLFLFQINFNSQTVKKEEFDKENSQLWVILQMLKDKQEGVSIERG